MVKINTTYLGSLPGLLKIATIVFVIISVSFGGHAYENSLYNLVYQLDEFLNISPISELPGLGRERFFLAIVGIVLTISVISLLCHSMNVGFQYDRKLKLMDIAYHVLAAVFLLIAGSLIIASSKKINNDICKKWDFETPSTPAVFPTHPDPTTTTPTPGTGSTMTTTEATTAQPEPSDPPGSTEGSDPMGSLRWVAEGTLMESDPDPLLSLLLSTQLIVQDFQGIHVDFSVLAKEADSGNFKCQRKAQKEAAGSFAILGSLLFAFVGVVLFLRLNSHPEPSPTVTMHDVAL